MNSTRAPMVSIGLPVYNGQNYLHKAIESLLSQTFEDFEVIICDNASADGTAGICRHYAALDGRIRYHRNELNLGAAPNFNRCFDLASGKYFKWAAHDDICLPDYLLQCVNHLEANPEVVLCHTGTEWIDADGRVVSGYSLEQGKFSDKDPIDRFSNAIDERHWCISVFGVSRREMLRQTTLIGSYVGSDRNLIAQISLLGRIDTLPVIHFQSRDHSERSIRAIAVKDRGSWFSTSNPGSGSYYYSRLLREHLRVLFRHPLSLANRIRGLLAIGHWTWRTNKRAMLAELRLAARSLFRVRGTP